MTEEFSKLKEFEDKLNVNPDFFGLFRDELLNMPNNPQIQGINIVDLSDKQVDKQVDLNKEFKSKKIVEKPTFDIIKSKDEINQTLHIIRDCSSIDDIKTKDELVANNTKNVCSSTTLNTDDFKNIKLDKYEMYKLEEIIKYFSNMNKN